VKGMALLVRAEEEGLGGRALANEPLARHTSYRIGGPADLYIVVRREEDLLGWVTLARKQEVSYFVMGRGTNLLVADEGIRGIVIENRCRGVRSSTRNKGVLLRVQAGGSLSSLARRTAKKGLGGLEWAEGIPGTVGGAIVNNAGAYGGSIAQQLQQVTLLDNQGVLRRMAVSELELGYRTSRFKGESSVILSADFALQAESADLLSERVASYERERRKSQPKEPSAGSVFKNPEGDHAGRLIEEAGLKGHRIGDAQISPLHANYIVNLGQAQARDVAALIGLVRERVWQKHGTLLELEIELVGDWEPEELAATIGSFG
jgi:UDP-N-acetylmuramate dehydrogenase